MLSLRAATISIYPAGTQNATAQVSGTFLAAKQYSVYVTDSDGGYQATILDDQNVLPPSGYFSVRILQQALKAGAVDIYFLPDGTKLSGVTPLLSAVAPGTVSTYMNVPSGTYDIVVFPTGATHPATNPVVYTSYADLICEWPGTHTANR